MGGKSNTPSLILCLTLPLSAMTLSTEVQWWVMVLLMVSAVGRLFLLAGWQKVELSNRTINLLSLLFALPLLYLGWQLGLLLAMLNLLLIAASLKLLRLGGNKDYFQLITVQLFIIACGFIFQQNMLYSLLYAGLIFATLVSLAYRVSPSLNWRQASRRVGVISLQAMPIAILLFLVLPKISPLWQVSTGSSATTGLSDTLNPGDIAKLSQSAELAFRANFDSSLPSQEQRYWRALVLERFDGQKWTIARHRKHRTTTISRQQRVARNEGPHFSYEVLSEPSPPSLGYTHWMSRCQKRHSLNTTICFSSAAANLKHPAYVTRFVPITNNPCFPIYPKLTITLVCSCLTRAIPAPVNG